MSDPRMEPPAARLFNIVAYSPESHGAFVRSTWAHGALRDGSARARARLDAHLAQDGARAIVAMSRESGRLVGWSARTADELLFCFVIVCMRHRGLAWLMLRDLGFGELRQSVDENSRVCWRFFGQPIPILHWTPSAQEVAARNGRVFFAMYPTHRHTERAA